MKTFICVAECGSLSRASDRLRIAQPALSRQIKLLEHHVGVPLFDRHIRGMELTEAGSELLRRVSGVVRQLETTMQDIQSAHTEISGNVALAVMPTIAMVVAARLVAHVARELPQVTLRIREGYSVDIIEWMQRGEVDISFLYGPSSDLHIRSKELLLEEIALISPPGALNNTGGQIDFDQVAGLPLVLPGRRYAMRRIIENAAKKAGSSLNIAYEVDSFFATRAMVMSGICHAFLPLASLAEEVSAGALEARSLGPAGLWRELVLGLPSERSNTRATNAVVEILMKEIALMVSQNDWIAQPGPELRQLV
ncbi:LysR family transcriptional regulator [Hoeflea sp. TYP-13]|uniref:LysR family transcriptional regulator n=1 Tax=Hoeflea sp. TYP-13 TaxID=3230023 RepID=UPI0034C6C93A